MWAESLEEILISARMKVIFSSIESDRADLAMGYSSVIELKMIAGLNQLIC
jgi:hypothetical protein